MQYLNIITPSLVYAIFVFLRFNFITIRSFSSIKDVYHATKVMCAANLKEISQLKLMVSCVLLILFSPYYAESSMFYNQYTGMLLVVTSLLSWLVMSYGSSFKINPMLSILVVIFVYSSALTLLTVNLVQLYLVFEVTAYINMIFLTFSVLNRTEHQNSSSSISGILVLFILNFITSIVFFSVILAYLSKFSILALNLLWVSDDLLTSTLLCIMVMVKLGSGPWLIGLTAAYKNYRLDYLLVYTICSVTLLTPIFVYLLQHSSLILIISSLVVLGLFISNTSTLISNLKELFAYSTALLYFYIILIIIL
jgi:hypothetical protein